MKLISLDLANFKGIRDLHLTPEGQNVSIFADNGVGKTTVADAFFWLLFGKDSHNSADFEIKTLDSEGNVLHGLDHAVCAVLETGDGKRIELRRSYKEKYTQKRGSMGSEMTGHETSFHINGVPVQKKEYESFVQEICPPKHFRILTDPTFFSSELHWQERRKTLMDMIGDISDAEIIELNNELAPLTGILGDRTIDDHRKVVAATKGKVNEELRLIPTQINECSLAIRSLPQKPGVTVAEIGTKLAELYTAKANLSASTEIANLETRKAQIGLELKNLEIELNAETTERIQAVQLRLGDKQVERQGVSQQLRQHNADLSFKKQQLTAKESQTARKRQEYHDENARAFAWQEGDTTCKTCGQEIPQNGVAERKAEAENSFNLLKSTNLEAIRAQGIKLKEEADALAVEIGGLETEIGLLEGKLKSLGEEVAAIEAELQAAKSSKVDPLTDPRGIALSEERSSIETKVLELKAGTTEAAAKIDAEIAELNALQKAHQEHEAVAEANARQEARRDQLDARQKQLAAEFERLTYEEDLTNQFIRAKVRMLTERINSRFQMASFQLFAEQINGGLSECCEATFNGVPYGSLNHGSKINVGLDIIQTLGEHLEFTPVVFVDNAESITRIMPTTAQQVRLIVSEADKALRVEYQRELVTA